jgi:N-acetylmuramoyl-L-alanine amidase
MSANPTRVDWDVMTAESGSPLQEGNRVLESIASQEALRALLAFSDLHAQIQDRRKAARYPSDRDLFETQRFLLDEVLQLICDRAQILTQADGILVALAEGPDMVCRAASGPLASERGVRLISESEFLQDCLNTGSIVRCDLCDTDPRVALDFSRVLGVRSTVLIPLRGRDEQLGVLQAFSNTASAFADHDVRAFDLFAELVLSALKPDDQDRRIQWLTDVADVVLGTKSAAALSVSDTAVEIVEASKLDGDNLVLALYPVSSELTELADIDEPLKTVEIDASPLPSAPPNFLEGLSLPERSRPGLSVVLSLVAVAALFSAGVWWGMRVQEKTSPKEMAATDGVSKKNGIHPQSVTAPAPPAEVLSLDFSDSLTNPAAKSASETTLPAASAENRLTSLSKITGVRHWSSAIGSTVVIDMDSEVPYEVHRLMSPERIYFDLHDTALSPGLDGKTMDVGDASLSRVRIAQPVAGVTRIVLDTRDGANFSVSMESSPYRLVVELRGNEKNLASSRSAPKRATAEAPVASVSPSAKTAPAAELAAKTSNLPLAARLGKFRIVLDAGHGGWDLGTVGRQGLLEKDLVLDVTQRLGKLLETRLKSEVMFTRTDDNYLPLDQRADMANQAQADLFVSVHANYSSSASARGVETYYTNLFSAPGLKEVEKHEDGTFSKPTTVALSAGGLHEKIEESRRLAASVQRFLHATLAANSPDIRNRGIKDSAFVVLTGTIMPSILTEISFVSSPADERNLRSATYRQQIAEALYKGIAHYQETTPHKIAELQTTAARR